MGFAMSRGPTGSHWGPDASKPSGRWTRPENKNGSYGYNAFATAGDMYDFAAGINHHPEYLDGSTAFFDTTINLMQEIGLRHVRSGLYNPAVANNDFGIKSQAFAVRLRQRSRSRAGTQQPLFQLFGTPQSPLYFSSQYSRPGHSEAWYSFTSWSRSLSGPPGVNQYAWMDIPNGPEGKGGGWDVGTFQALTWDGVSALQGPNEPHQGNPAEGDGSLRDILSDLQDGKNALTTTRVMDGEEFIDFDTGRITRGNAFAPRIPVFGFGGIPGGLASYQAFGDYVGSTNFSAASYPGGSDIDFGAPHYYWGGHEPWFGPGTATAMWSPWFNSVGNSQFNSMRSYNGGLNAASYYNKTIPMVCTETGYYMDGSGSDQACVADVGAEYFIRTMIMYYIGGIKRVYWYKLMHENSPNMGHCTNTGVRLPSFWAHKNLLQRIGWREPSVVTPISVGIECKDNNGNYVAGFVPGPSNQSPGEGQTWVNDPESSPDRLDKLIIQTAGGNGVPREYLIFLCRNRTIWHRVSKTRQTVADPKQLRISLPSSTTGWAAFVSEPAKNPYNLTNILGGSGRTGAPGTPNDGQTYANITDGMAEVPLTIDGSGRISDFMVAGLTRVIRITEQATPPTPPVITITAPGSTTNVVRPVIAGTAGLRVGDATAVHVNITSYATSTPTEVFAADVSVAQSGAQAGTWTVTPNVDLANAWHIIAVTQESSAGQGITGQGVNVQVATSEPWEPADVYQQRVKNELQPWLDWLDANGAKGFLGEFGWPNKDDSNTQNDVPEWQAVADGVYKMLIAEGVWSAQWAASQAFANLTTYYELALYNSAGPGDPLHITLPLALPMETAALEDPAPANYHGCAITGMEFGMGMLPSSGATQPYHNGNPGQIAIDWFPEPVESWQYIASKGIPIARVGFSWERLQPTLNGALDTASGGYLEWLKGQVDNARSVGMKVVLDCHNYGRYKTSTSNDAVSSGGPLGGLQLGSGALPYSALSNLWVRLSDEFKNDSAVIAYGIMNEPHDLPGAAAAWEAGAQAVLTAIRGNSDNKLIMIAGYNWSKTQGWQSQHPDGFITDPANNFRYEGHMYNDTESSVAAGGVGTGAQDSVYDYTYAEALSDSSGTTPPDLPRVTVSGPQPFATIPEDEPLIVSGQADTDAGVSSTVTVRLYDDQNVTVDEVSTTRTSTGFYSAQFNTPPPGDYSFRCFQTDTNTGLTGRSTLQFVTIEDVPVESPEPPHIIIPSAAATTLGDNFTISFWVRRERYSNWLAGETFLDQIGGISIGFQTFFSAELLMVNTGPGTTAAAFIYPADDLRHHVAIVKAPGVWPVAYVDGKAPNAPTAGPLTISDGGDIFIGCDRNLEKEFVGELGDLAMFKSALTAAQIRNHYQSARGVSEPTIGSELGLDLQGLGIASRVAFGTPSLVASDAALVGLGGIASRATVGTPLIVGGVAPGSGISNDILRKLRLVVDEKPYTLVVDERQSTLIVDERQASVIIDDYPTSS